MRKHEDSRCGLKGWSGAKSGWGSSFRVFSLSLPIGKQRADPAFCSRNRA